MKFVRLDEIAKIQIGKTPKRAVAEYWGKGFPWVSIADMKTEIITRTKEQITNQAIKECGCKLIPKGSLIMSFKLSVGKLAFAGSDLFTNEAICALLIKDQTKINTKYFYYALKNTKLTGSNNAVMGHTLNTDSLNSLKIPLVAKLSDQNRIAEILSQAEILITQRKKSINLLDELLKSTFLELFGDPVRNEKKWEIKTIEQLVKKEKYSIKRGPFGGALKKEIFVAKGYLVYEQYHALNDDFTFERYYIDDAKFEELKAFEVSPDDIIISCSGVYLGKLALIPKNAKRGIINQALLKISLDQKIISNKFFVFLFRHESFKNKFFGDVRGSGVPNFPPMPEFKKFQFIYPSIALQNKFVNIIDKVEVLKTQYQQSLIELQNMYGVLSQKAFKGELNIKEVKIKEKV